MVDLAFQVRDKEDVQAVLAYVGRALEALMHDAHSAKLVGNVMAWKVSAYWCGQVLRIDIQRRG